MAADTSPGAHLGSVICPVAHRATLCGIAVCLDFNAPRSRSRTPAARHALWAAAAAAGVAALGSRPARGDVLEGFNFFGLAPSATVPANNVSSGLDVADPISRGAGAPASTANNSFRTTGFKNDGIATANTDYFQIDASAAAGNTLSLSNLLANFAGTASFYAGSGVSTEFAYSLDGSTFTLAPSTLTTITAANLTNVSYDLSSVSALQNLSADTTVTLRFYASGQTTTGGFGFYSGAATTQGLQLNGTVASTTPLTYDPTATGGGTASTVFANAGPANFLNNAGADVAYADGRAVIFDDSGVNASGGSATVTVDAAGVSPGSLAVTNTTGTYTFAGPGGINGPTALVKSGGGALVLATSNAYAGGTTVNGGTVSVSADANLGTGNLTLAGGTLQATGSFTSAKVVSVTAASTFDTGPNAVAFTGTYSGNGAITKLGTGGLTITPFNTSVGSPTVSQGSLTLDTTAASAYATLGTPGSTTVEVDGTLNIGTTAANRLAVEPIDRTSIQGPGTIQIAPGSSIVQYASGSTVIYTAIALNSAGGVNPDLAANSNGTLYLPGSIVDGPAGPAGLTFNGPTTGTAAYNGYIEVYGQSSYSGGTKVASGTVIANNLDDNTRTPLGTGPVTITSTGNARGYLEAGGTLPNTVTIAGGTLFLFDPVSTAAETWNASGGLEPELEDGTSNVPTLTVPSLTINATAAAAFAVTLFNNSAGMTVGPAGSQVLLAIDQDPTQRGVFANALAAAALTLNPGPFTASDGSALTLTEVDTDGGEELVLDVGTPEPTSLLLLATAAAPMAIGRRRLRATPTWATAGVRSVGE